MKRKGSNPGLLGHGALVFLVSLSQPSTGREQRLGTGLRTLSSEELSEQVLAVLREALSNVARHAGASRADVTVDVDHDGILSVIVTDNGTGLPPEGRRSGLRNLADRAKELGGELRLGQADPAAPRPGTRLEWRVPAATVPASMPDG